MPERISRELQAHEAEILARVMDAMASQAGVAKMVASDPDANIQRQAMICVRAAEPAIAALTLRAFAEGAEKALPGDPLVRLGALSVINAMRDTATRLEQSWPA